MTIPRRKNVGAILLGLILVGVTANASEGQSTGRLQVTARVLDVRSQQAALTQAWLALGQVQAEKDLLQARPADGLIFLTVRRADLMPGPGPAKVATASLVYIAN